MPSITFSLFAGLTPGFCKNKAAIDAARPSLLATALGNEPGADQALLHLAFGLAELGMESNELFTSLAEASNVSGVSRERASFIYNYLQLIVKGMDLNHKMIKLNPHIEAICSGSSNTVLVESILADLYLTGFGGRLPADPERAIMLHRSLKIISTDVSKQAYHQSMVDHLTWLNDIQFFAQFELIHAKMKRNLEKSQYYASYARVATTSQELCNALERAKKAFLHANSGSIEEQKRVFLANCRAAITASEEVLSVHRGWSDTAATIYNWFIWGITFGRVDYRESAIRTGTYSYYFRPQTESAQVVAPLKAKLLELERVIAPAVIPTGATDIAFTSTALSTCALLIKTLTDDAPSTITPAASPAGTGDVVTALDPSATALRTVAAEPAGGGEPSTDGPAIGAVSAATVTAALDPISTAARTLAAAPAAEVHSAPGAAAPAVAGAGISSVAAYKVSAEISGTKVRIYIKGHNGSSPGFLTPILGEMFSETPGSFIPAYVNRYSAIGFTRCYQILETSARLEFWYPSAERLGNAEATRLIDILLKALGLTEGELPAGATFSSISALGDREYKDIIPETTVSVEKIIPLCNAFKAATEAFKKKRGCEFDDAISIATAPVAEASRSGTMLFLAPTGALSTHRPTGGVTAGMGGT